MSTVTVRVEFGGGLELLFSNQKSHRLTIPARVPIPESGPTANSTDGKAEPTPSTTEGRPADITYLMYWLRDNLLKEREELFIENGTVYVQSIQSAHPLAYNKPMHDHQPPWHPCSRK